MAKQTYLEHIQDMRQKITAGYVYAGILRDAGTANEKDLYNDIRGALDKALNKCEKLEQLTIDQKRNDMVLAISI